MKYHLNTGNSVIEYTIKESDRAQNIRLSVYADKGVLVTIPVKNYSFQKYILYRKVELFVRSKATWILAALKKFEERSKRPGAEIVIKSSKKDYKKYKEIARELVHAKLDKFNQFYDFTFHKVAIRNQKSRWGSCSKKGNLNFNYKIALLPDNLANYLIVHELCHLKEFNHGKNFWSLVEQTIPDYKDLRKRLKNVG